MKKCTSFTWTLRTEPKLTKAQEKILKEFFENGPNLRYGINKKSQSKSRHGRSYNENLDTLVQLRLLHHEEFHKELKSVKNPNLDSIEPNLRYAVREAFKKRDYGCPPKISRQRWKEALDAYRISNYNDRIGNKIGESLYHLTIWGVMSHLRKEGKLLSGRIVLKDYNLHSDASELKSGITDEDLDKVLPHLMNFSIPVPAIIQRKWDYLCQSNSKEIAYIQLLDSLKIANYYYEWLHADFARFENSAEKDILLHFLIPYRLNQPYADNWIKSIVRDREIFDLLMDCFSELREYYKSSQEIINEYGNILKEARGKGTIRTPKFLKNDYFSVRLPSYFGQGFFAGHGPWGYRLSYFLNELDSGPIEYTWAITKKTRQYRTKQNKGTMKTLSISTAKPKENKKYLDETPSTTIEML